MCLCLANPQHRAKLWEAVESRFCDTRQSPYNDKVGQLPWYLCRLLDNSKLCTLGHLTVLKLTGKSIHILITSSKGKLDAIYPSLLATINNIAPYAERLNAQASSKLLQLFASMSSPSFLLANETNYSLLQSLLESINAIIEHQYKGEQNI